MNNLHISLTSFENASRVLKQTSSISKLGFIDTVFIASLHEDGLVKDVTVKENIFLKRFSLLSRKLPKNLFAQSLKYIEFLFKVAFYYRNKNIKMVNVHSVALLPLGVLLKFLYKAKLIYDTHELETEQGEVGIRKKLLQILERVFIKFSDQTFVVSENIADWYRDAYFMVRPPVIFNVPPKKVCSPSNKFRENLGIKPEQTIFLYQGGLAQGRGIELIIEAFENLESTNAVVVFMGYGQLDDLVKKKSASCENIYFYPAVDPYSVLTYTSSADIGLSLIENNCLSYSYCMPNKLFEYAMAGLPVVVSDVKEMREFIEKYKMGVALQAYTVDELLKVIKSLLSQDVSQMKKNARKAALENSWEVQEAKMLDVYKQLFGNKR